MGALDALFELPGVPAILQRLVDNPEGVDEALLLALPPGEKAVQRAISLLLDAALISRTASRLVLCRDREKTALIGKILALFRRIEAVTSTTLVFRGLLNATQGYRCLIHRETLTDMLAAEGYGRSDLERTLSAEDEAGYVERIAIQYRMIGRVRERFFPFIPYHHYHDFIFMTGRHTREAGAIFTEEQYLLSRHPSALAEQGRRYALAATPGLIERICAESFDIIWWYDRY